MAATVIQDAVDAASAGDTVLVMNGVYSHGGRVESGYGLTNRVLIDKPLTVQSVNGPSVTIIAGQGPLGDRAVRCAHLTGGSVLAGFTLSGGHTASNPRDEVHEGSGGGVWCDDTAMVSNCIIEGNSAQNHGAGTYRGTIADCVIRGNYAVNSGGGTCDGTIERCTVVSNSAYSGGGSYRGTLTGCRIMRNTARGIPPVYAGGGGGVFQTRSLGCLIAENSAPYGGGAWAGTLNNCTVVGNVAAYSGGGTSYGTIKNCILYYNSAESGDDNHYSDNSITYSCTTPSPGGGSNITNNPGILGIRNPHLTETSPCIGTGVGGGANAAGVDIDGDPYPATGGRDIGCDQYVASSATGALTVVFSVSITNALANRAITFQSEIGGRAAGYAWDFGDGSDPVFGEMVTTHAYAEAGTYEVTLSAWNSSGSRSTGTVVRVVRESTTFVSLGGSNLPPYTNWQTAARSIQDAISANVIPGGVVLVSNGVYDTGGVVEPGYGLTNRVLVDRPLTVRSVNGPGVTIIAGQGPLGDGAVRCAHLTGGCVLAGFTLSGGHTASHPRDLVHERRGGGVWCDDTAMVSNCIIEGNSSQDHGAGTYQGTIVGCLISGNYAANYGGGSCDGTVERCTIVSNSAHSGGGSYLGTLIGCRIFGNTARGIPPLYAGVGGGVCEAKMLGCLMVENQATYGGGAWAGTLNNCTVVGNHAGTSGGGVYGGTMLNSIAYFNTAPIDRNHTSVSECHYSCTIPLSPGPGNVAEDPLLVNPASGDYRLSAMSPCVDAGHNVDWVFDAVDLEGKPRCLNGNVDIGAYETIFHAVPRVLLQGACDGNDHGNTMTALLSESGFLPLMSPYRTSALFQDAVSSNVTDWVHVELRETNGSVVVSQSAFVDSQGNLVSGTGEAGIVAEVSPGERLHLHVKHRNHLAVVSAVPLVFTNTVVTYDFTLSADSHLGGPAACVRVGGNRWAMIAGDANGDGRITPVDLAIVSNSLGKTGYLSADLNLDGKVDGKD